MAQIPAATNQLVAWLDDAYAMESGLIPILHNNDGILRPAVDRALGVIELRAIRTARAPSVPWGPTV